MHKIFRMFMLASWQKWVLSYLYKYTSLFLTKCLESSSCDFTGAFQAQRENTVFLGSGLAQNSLLDIAVLSANSMLSACKSVKRFTINLMTILTQGQPQHEDSHQNLMSVFVDKGRW